MIYGIGTDMAEIARIKALTERHSSLARVYGANELQQLDRLESFAAAFCAKEAFSKALGTGIRGFRLSEVEVLHDELGKPYFLLSGDALKISARLDLTFHLSITHTEKYAAAFVVAERRVNP